MKVEDAMVRIKTVPLDMSACDVAMIMDEHNLSSVLVEDGGPVGIITEKDLLRKVVKTCKNPSRVRASDIMTAPLYRIDINAPLAEAAKIMEENQIRRVLVTKNGIIVGKVTTQSLARNMKYLLGRKVMATHLSNLGR